MRLASRLPAILVAGIALSTCLHAADPLPPLPARPVADRADILSAGTEADLNERLDAYERETSNQVLVATFPSVPEDYAMEDFTQRTAESWGVGRADDDNGAVLFVFRDDRKLRIEVGYGLEGAIPDATAKAILDREITPRFRSGDFDGGVTRGVDAILAAARGEYTGDGSTVGDLGDETHPALGFFILLIFVLFFVGLLRFVLQGVGDTFGPGGRTRRRRFTPMILPGQSRSRWGGGGGLGGGGGFGGGGFGGGGGSFGGGGASGGW